MKIPWTSKTIIALLILLALLFGWQKFRQYRLQKSIETEKANLQKQLSDLEGKNQELDATLSFLNSKAYKEVVARQQLNMQKAGEFVYGFSEKPSTAKNIGGQNQSSDFQKWVNYFLGKTNE